MAVPELALLDGRYQLLRQLGGTPRSPLMVASDLQRGKVVCLRLQQFTTAMANLAAVPPLALDPGASADGPLLPYDFGVDDGTAYLVRDFVTATTLEELITQPNHLSPGEVLAILRRTGEALLSATAQGFDIPELALHQVLIATDGRVHVTGYDVLHAVKRPVRPGGEQLAGLVWHIYGGPQRESLPAPLRALLSRMQAWPVDGAPPLPVVVRYLRRTEEQLLGYSRVRAYLTASARVLRALWRRLRYLGPLLHPYLIVVGLVVAIVLAAGHALVAPAGPGRLYVYAAPTRAAAPPAYPFAAPPEVVSTAGTPVQETAGALTVPSPASTSAGAAAAAPGSAGSSADAPTTAAPLAPIVRPLQDSPRAVAAESQPRQPATAPTRAAPTRALPPALPTRPPAVAAKAAPEPAVSARPADAHPIVISTTTTHRTAETRTATAAPASHPAGSTPATVTITRETVSTAKAPAALGVKGTGPTVVSFVH